MTNWRSSVAATLGIGGIAPTGQPNSHRPCSIDVTDFADIFTVDRSHKVMNITKILAHLNKPFRRYRCHKYGWVQ